MLRAIVISNGIGAADAYQTADEIRYDVVEVGLSFDPDFTGYDLLLVPNGSDHVAMLRIRAKVRAFLDGGGALFCFCGWFTDWIPGNRWVHDNSHPTKDVRHHLGMDRSRAMPAGTSTEFTRGFQRTARSSSATPKARSSHGRRSVTAECSSHRPWTPSSSTASNRFGISIITLTG